MQLQSANLRFVALRSVATHTESLTFLSSVQLQPTSLSIYKPLNPLLSKSLDISSYWAVAAAGTDNVKSRRSASPIYTHQLAHFRNCEYNIAGKKIIIRQLMCKSSWSIWSTFVESMLTDSNPPSPSTPHPAFVFSSSRQLSRNCQYLQAVNPS